ncbi:hypothetical protein SteCoe_27131 [Stentor coeruleus]|uniref:DUF4378 domain-containing protein n=1 Tax=Stentor coeruleus TaxID=5963 RepID=A0A1R2BBJ6_9CILI|nr:hypothetical protein SteCoe_27131 [Stentor coeruleus]
MESFQNELEMRKRQTLAAKPTEIMQEQKKKRIVRLKQSSFLDPRLLCKSTLGKKIHTPKKKTHKDDISTIVQRKSHRNHQVNLSEIVPDFISREKSRPKSVINNSFLTLSYTKLKKKPKKDQKILTSTDMQNDIKSFKQSSNPSTINKIIKKSLKNAHRQKASLEKQQKLSQLLKEIKKNEIDYQNKQIRLQNSIKTKKSKNRSNNRSSPGLDLNNISTMITENSHKHKSKTAFSVDSTKTNKRSRSVESKARDASILAYMKKKKIQLRKEKEEEKIKKSAIKAVKIGKLKNLDCFIRDLKEKSVDESFESDFMSSDREKKREINRNISFICEDLSEQSGKDYDYEGETTIFKDLSENENKVTETREEVIERYVKWKKDRDMHNQTPKINNFISDMKIFRQEGINCWGKTKDNVVLSEEKVLDLGVKACEKVKEADISKCENIEVKAVMKRKAELIMEQVNTINIKKKVERKRLNFSGMSGITIIPNKPKINTKGLLEEQLSWNLALNFLIEQLQIYEITNVSEFSEDIHDSLMNTIQKKYSSLLNYISGIFETKSSEILEFSTLEEHSKFIQSTQKKKLALHRILIENSEAYDVKSFKPMEKESEHPVSSESEEENEEENDEEMKSGISHSRSLVRLHDEVSSKHKKPDDKPENKDFSLSFGFERGLSIENKDFSHKTPEENSETNPDFHLSLQKVDSISDRINPFMDFDKIKTFILSVFMKIDTEKLIKDLNKPLIKNPLTELDKLQELQIGTPTETEIFIFPELFCIESLIPDENYTDPLAKNEKLFHKMLLHTLNYLLQQFRPFGYKGLPFPWINYSKVPKKPLIISQIIEKVIMDMEDMNEMEIGNFPDISFSNGEANEALIIKIKEKQLEKTLFYEAFYEDYKWVDYEFEETQVKIDITDMILHDLAEEIINFNL